MGKKLLSTERWKRRITVAQEREASKSGRSYNHAGKGRSDRSHSKKRPWSVTPPSVLSLLENPEPTIRFLRELEQAIPKYQVRIIFDHVQRITPDAPLALLGTLKKFGNRTVGGTMPMNVEARALLEQSGFFDHVKHVFKIEGACQGVMVQYTGKRVDPQLAQRLILHGTELLFGQPENSEPSYSILVEGMENTIAHAHRLPSGKGLAHLEAESWWASVFVDRQRKRICFALVDVGVGILKSARVKALRRANLFWRRAPEEQLLLDIVDGKLPSRTGLRNRGKGLPAIKALSDRGEVHNLTLVTNAVHAAFEPGRTITLAEGFKGTLLYWEIASERIPHLGGE